jgi:hypothetical protein
MANSNVMGTSMSELQDYLTSFKELKEVKEEPPDLNVSIEQQQFAELPCVIPQESLSSSKSSDEEEAKENGGDGNVPKNTVKARHQCSLCPKSFDRRYFLNVHMNTHTGARPFSCTHCQASFASPSALLVHNRRKHSSDRPYPCKYCGHDAASLFELKIHVSTHTKDILPCKCPHCPMKYMTKARLAHHVKQKHSGPVERYSCEVCSKVYAQKRGLVRHVRQKHPQLECEETGKEVVVPSRFICEFCHKTYAYKSDLNVHVRSQHNREIPVTCLQCHKTFVDKHAYLMHEVEHRKEQVIYRCKLCPFLTVSLHYLDMHLEEHEQLEEGEVLVQPHASSADGYRTIHITGNDI